MSWPIEQLLPHAGAMILLDELIECEIERVVCTRRVQRGAAFTDRDGLPAWAGIELMAQTIAAWNGYNARVAGQPVRPGFLLGTRSYRCNVQHFPIGTELRIEAVRGFHDDEGMAAFICRIEAQDMLAEARLTVFSPPDASVLLDPETNIIKEPTHG
ncbi:putative hotdog family 3-hydroxylacyl-ACP dehydratase [Luteibacter sp. Sphag1AF]|uniref:ApeP family dehydratase n=1 Tax=Luteibacter sp. Sphag1AF TaxID=2587031 RepID=UPI0017B37B5F|nr:hotdog family protein [Luteibacter sp. Sphag1AF]MBB3227271.1 putative hotdog family 3-hydroxylacyl-ACP dehydratase [Luteibacter sp. Sphag1AF]